MSKSKKANKYYDDYNEDDYDSYSYEEYRERKKNKRLTSALKKKNVDDIIRLSDEDYEDYE